MVAKTEEVVTNKLDSFKLLLAIAILILGIVGFYYYESESLLYRVLGVVFTAVVAVAISSTTHLGQSLISFGREARMEVRKVVWPTRQETVQTTFMVIVAVVIIGIFLWIVDMLLAHAIQLITGSGA
jgi:preprotein translocase subunit SecE